MFHRLMIVIYILLHIPIPFLVLLAFYDSGLEHWKTTNYNVVCNAGKPIILEGDSAPLVINDYTLEDPNYENRINSQETYRFYCQYPSETSEFVDHYNQAKTISETVEVNKKFWAFRDSANITPVQNYTIKRIGVEANNDYLYGTILTMIFYPVAYWLLIQLSRIIYVYVVFGKLVWKPYSQERSKLSMR